MKRGVLIGILCGMVLSVGGCIPVYAADYSLDPENYLLDPAESDDPSVNSWLSYLPDDSIDFEQYNQIMEIMYPELSEEYWEDMEEEYSEEDMEIASRSDATRSDADRKDTYDFARLTVNNVVAPSPASSYPSPDDSSISETVLQYFKDMLVKLPYNTQYVFFRVNDYEYRLVYGSSIVFSNNVFTGSDLNYIKYYRPDSYNSPWKLSSGYEGDFTLSPNGYLVYTNVADLYPSMNGGVYSHVLYACLFVLVVNLLYIIVHAFFSVSKYRI